MTKSLRVPFVAEPSRRSLRVSQAPTPSWLAPPFTAPLSAQAAPAPSTPPADAAPTYSPPSIHVAPDQSASSLHADEAAVAVAEGERAAVRAEIDELRAQLAEQAAVLAEVRRAILVASEPDLVRLSCVIAERVVGRELTIDPALFVSWARDAMEALAGSDDLCLSLSPDLAALVTEDAFRAALSSLASVEIDASLGSLQCEARTKVSRVTASLEARLGAVVEELGVPTE